MRTRMMVVDGVEALSIVLYIKGFDISFFTIFTSSPPSYSPHHRHPQNDTRALKMLCPFSFLGNEHVCMVR